MRKRIHDHIDILQVAQRELHDMKFRVAQLEHVVWYHKEKIRELTPPELQTPSTTSEVSNAEGQSEKNPGPPVPETDAACYDAPRTTSVDADPSRIDQVSPGESP